ncbi:alcohol dehydrogenase GroES-like domain-containing protein [Paramyrothecium foliicola]|nr:alcohol dehydrogenase GroES-like domain-containing protein [Paramyrothecium foliicola]
MAIQQSMECLIQSPDGGKASPIVSRSHPIPKVEHPYDVLIKVTAVALNPTDFKSPESNPTPGAIIGCDFAGTAISIGSEVHGISTGQRLSGFVHGSNPGNLNTGAFAEYLVADARLLIRIPESWSDLEAAALGGVGWGTVALAMESSLLLPGLPSRPHPPRGDGTRHQVLVYGGATATGTMACQLLTSAGYDPIAVASPASSVLAKSYGASSTFSYASPTCGEAVREHTNGTLRHALDCITSPESVNCCYTALARAGARYSSLDYAAEEWRTRRAVKVDQPMTYALYGREVQLKGNYHRDADPAKLELGARWRLEVQGLVDQGRLKCHPVRELPGRWQGIIKGLAMLKAEQVRGQKLVVRL